MQFPDTVSLDLFVACVDDSVRDRAFALVQECRDADISTEMDHQQRSLKSQFKLADKLGAKRVAILGPDELAQNCAKVRNMENHEEQLVSLDEITSLLA